MKIDFAQVCLFVISAFNSNEYIFVFIKCCYFFDCIQIFMLIAHKHSTSLESVQNI